LRSTEVLTPDDVENKRPKRVKMNERTEAEEALILDDENDNLTYKEIQQVIDEALHLGEGIEEGSTKLISVPEGGKLYLFSCKNMPKSWNKVLLNDSYRYVMKSHSYLSRYKFD
jgi:hypothetical protein